MPWRNGRGTTLEIAREPPRGEEFPWRLSLADIAEDGNFSAYPGYSRALALVAGQSLQLRFRGHGHSFLDPVHRGARFEGGWETRCTIPKGRYKTMNLNGIFVREEGLFMQPANKGRYYHDGRFATLMDVVNHYDTLFHLGLTEEEKHDLIEYLKSLPEK